MTAPAHLVGVVAVPTDESGILATPRTAIHQIDKERALTRLANELYGMDLSPEARIDAVAESLDGYSESRPVFRGREQQACIVVSMPSNAEPGGWPDFKHGDTVLCNTKGVNEWRRLASACGGMGQGEMHLLDQSGERAVALPSTSIVMLIPVSQVMGVVAEAESVL